MEKKQQLLIISPENALTFRGPYDKPVTTIMTLKNPTEHTIAFKVKTTAPRRYCVRPNFGTIEPGKSTAVSICLQVVNFDAADKNKHKFMVQSFILTDKTDVDNENLWKEVHPDQLMDSKLRCIFDLPAESVKSDVQDDLPEDPSKEVISKTVGEEKIPEGILDMPHYLEVLRESITELRMENLHLKDEIVQLKTMLASKSNEQATRTTSTYQSPYTPQLVGQQTPMVYIGLAIVMALLGLLFGKYLL